MNRVENLYPQPDDIKPTCFVFNPEIALSHAYGFVERFKLSEGIRPAAALIIPSEVNTNQILYGLRDPLYSEEFPNAWGLPSTSISIEMFKNLCDKEGRMNLGGVREAIDLLTNKKQKLPRAVLTPEKIVGWTGRLRFKNGYDGNYYLIMVGILTSPVNPNDIPESSVAYSEFRWLTPKEHMKVVEETPSKACGACSALAYQVFLKEGRISS